MAVAVTAARTIESVGNEAQARRRAVEFPVYVHVGPLALHPHWLFETLAYLVGVRLYVVLKARGGDPLPAEQRWWIVAAAMVGAVVGSRPGSETQASSLLPTTAPT